MIKAQKSYKVSSKQTTVPSKMETTQPGQEAMPDAAISPLESPDKFADTIKHKSAEQVQRTVLGLQSQIGNRAVQNLLQRNLSASNPGVIQRAAIDWKSWAEGDGGLGTENTFADAGSLVVINDAFEASEAFLNARKSADIEELKDIIKLAKLLKDNNFDPKAQALNAQCGTRTETKTDKTGTKVVPLSWATFLQRLQSSGGLRVRFRSAIGPTPSGKKVSIVDTYLTGTVAKACGGIDNLPEYLTTAKLTPADRVRLYDLPNNPSHKEAESIEAIQWALTQSPAPTSPRQFVNYVEYYFASKAEMEYKAEKKENDLKDEKEQTITIGDTDSRLEATAKTLAEAAAKQKFNGVFGKFFGKKDTAIGTQDAEKINQELTSKSLVATPLVTETTTGNQLKAIAGTSATAVANTTWATFTEAAKIALKEKDVTAAIATALKDWKEKEIEKFGENYNNEQAAVTTEGHSGDGPLIPEFGTHKTDFSYIQTQIATLAASNKIPFTSNDSAAYHSLKHYKEIAKTEDGVASSSTAIEKLKAYLASCNKTISTGTGSLGQPAQFGELPGFFFIRDVPAKTSGEAAQKMRAIVIVTTTGNVKVATYFQAP